MNTNPLAQHWALGLSLALLALSPAAIHAEQFGLFTYAVAGDTVSITNYPRDAVGAVEIPAEIDGKPVTVIGWSAFTGCSGLTSITIPDSVTEIHNFAFEGCEGLTCVTIASSAVIRDYAFEDCTNLDCMVFLGHSPRFEDCVFSTTPRIKVVGEAPAPRVDDGSLSIRFNPSHRGFGYRVETSRDLVHWTTEGVLFSGILPDGDVLASVPIDGPARFLRLVPYITNWTDNDGCGGLG